MENELRFTVPSATSEKVVTISEAGSEVDDELVRLQQSKRDEISAITSQLQDIKDPQVMELIQQGLKQITSEDLDFQQTKTEQKSSSFSEMVDIEMSKRKTVSSVLSPLQSVLPPDIFESVNASIQNVAKLETGQDGQNTIISSSLSEKQVQNITQESEETSSKIVRQGKVSVIEIGSGENSASKQIDEIDSGSDVTGKPKESETPKPSEQSEQPKIPDQAQRLEKSEETIDKSQKSEDTPEPDDLNASTASKESKKSVPKIISAIKKISQNFRVF